MWTAIFLIVCVVFTWLTIDSLARARSSKPTKAEPDHQTDDRIKALEKRVAAMEDLIVEREKNAKFDQL